MKLMVTRNMVSSLQKVLLLDVFCKGCVLQKHHREHLGSGIALHTLKPLELVHSDLCCINKTSLSGVRYVLTFINDISHYNWIYFLMNKIHFFERFKAFRALNEK